MKATKVGSRAHRSGDTQWAVGAAEQTGNSQHWEQSAWGSGTPGPGARGVLAPVEQKLEGSGRGLSVSAWASTG